MSALRNVNLEIPAAAVGGQHVEAVVRFQFRSMNGSFPTVIVVELIAEVEVGESVVFASTLTSMTCGAELHSTGRFETHGGDRYWCAGGPMARQARKGPPRPRPRGDCPMRGRRIAGSVDRSRSGAAAHPACGIFGRICGRRDYRLVRHL